MEQNNPQLLPDIVTALPGPNTKTLMERDKQYISPSYTRGYPLAIDHGYGAMVVDVDGNRFLDFCAGIAVCSTGHSHPEIVKVINEQSQKFLHMSGTDFYYRVMVDLAEKLAKVTPGSPDKKVFFANSGAEANEGALKLARYHTRRSGVIAFYRSFHGRTYGAMSLAASKAVQRTGFAPLVSGIHHAHYPYPYRDVFNTDSPEACAQACLNYIEDYLFKMVIDPSEVAAFFVEPIQGEGGYIVPPPSFIQGLQNIARKHGILIIADEVQAGVGRTGKMYASSHFDGFEPDIITSAKGLASGLPLGAIIAKSSVMTWPPGAHATTFGGNPVACAAAMKTLEMVEECLCENASQEGAYLKGQLENLLQKFGIIGEIRGLGLMLGAEIIEPDGSKAPKLRDWIVDECFEHGLLILGCGENSIRFSPPLIITRQQTDKALEIFEAVLVKAAAQTTVSV